ncbi:MAG: hypothetical protein R3E46_14745 [Sedimenticolaceae bacterium]
MRARILAEAIDPDPTIVLGRLAREFDPICSCSATCRTTNKPFEQSIFARAQRAGVTRGACLRLRCSSTVGRNMLYVTLCNYEHGSLETSRAMMRHPAAVLGLGDGGAHCGTICDGSFPIFMLAYWVARPHPWRAAEFGRERAGTLCRDTARAGTA